MKVVNSYIFRSVCAVLIGILLVYNPSRITTLLVQVIGGLFLLSGLLSIISYLIIRFSDKATVIPMFPLVGVGSFLFGLFLGFFPSYFVAYLMFLLGILLVLAGINQLWNTVKLRKVLPFSWWSFLLSIIFMAIGILVIFKPMETASLPFILLGCSMIIYGITELINGIRWRKFGKNEITITYDKNGTD